MFVLGLVILVTEVSAASDVTFPAGRDYVWAREFEKRTDIVNVEIPVGITMISAWAFAECINMRSLSLPEGLLKIDDSAFSRCTSLPSVRLPDSLEEMVSGVFDSCIALTSIYIGPKIDALVRRFVNSYSLRNVEISPNNPYFVFDSSLGVVLDRNRTSIVMGTTRVTNLDTTDWNGVRNMEIYAFQNFKSIVTAVIYGTIERVDHCFYGCTNLVSVKFGPNVKVIVPGGFAVCNSLTTVVVDAENSMFKSVSNVLYSKDEAELIWYPCAHVQAIFNIPAGCARIKERAFYQTKVQEFTVDAGNPYLVAYDKAVYTKDLKKLVLFPPSRPNGAVLWPTGLEVIGVYAVENMYVRDFIMPSTVTTYELAAMSFSNMVTADVRGGKNFGASTFSNDGRLTGLLLPPDMTYMPDSMCRGTALPRISFPSTMKIIGPGVFYNSPATQVTFPEGLVEIQSTAFAYCQNLADPVFPQSLEQIGKSAFTSCSSLVNLVFRAKLKYIDFLAFSYCNKIESVRVENCRVTKIHPRAFAYCIYVLDYEYCGPTDTFTADVNEYFESDIGNMVFTNTLLSLGTMPIMLT